MISTLCRCITCTCGLILGQKVNCSEMLRECSLSSTLRVANVLILSNGCPSSHYERVAIIRPSGVIVMMQSYIIEPRGGPTLVISYTCHWTREAFSVMMYRAQRKWWIGVLYFNFTSHISRTKFTELQCLLWCPYVFFLSTIVGWNAWILSSLGTVLVT